MDKTFAELAESIMDEFLGWDPSYATQVGWHKYDHVLRNPSEEARTQICGRLQDVIRDLKGIPSESLSADDRLDRDLALHIMELKLFEIDQLRFFERQSLAGSEVGYSLFFLFARDHPSFDERLESMIHRLEAVPAFLAESSKSLKSPYRIWNETALETGLELPELIRDIERLAEAKCDDPLKKRRLAKAAKAAIDAVDEDNRRLREEVIPRASPRFTIGYDEYESYLRMNGWGVSPEEALRIGEKYLKLVRNRMSEVAGRMVSSGDLAEAMESMRSDHPPTFELALKEYREAAKMAREFLVSKDLMTIPENEKLFVIETPMFMRPMCPSAAQFEPGKFDGVRTGMFLVTPDEEHPELLREHSYAGIGNTTVHEAYPGHHLQGICSNTNPSFIRILIASPDFGEGWGLYSEELMIASGFNDDPSGRFANLNDLMFRVVRLVVEVKMARGDLTIEDAAEVFIRECAMDRKTSWIEARSCAMSPTYSSSYFLGKLAIMQL
ncbi:MAG: DUF885 domain-containing protein, partial [Candidatus Thermoplasmatota archaeon]|nr:DUF885 domain-containing protein [Candidatus Thermoplasmatota archaeon]